MGNHSEADAECWTAGAGVNSVRRPRAAVVFARSAAAEFFSRNSRNSESAEQNIDKKSDDLIDQSVHVEPIDHAPTSRSQEFTQRAFDSYWTHHYLFFVACVLHLVPMLLTVIIGRRELDFQYNGPVPMCAYSVVFTSGRLDY